MMKKNNLKNNNASSQIPCSLWEAFFHFLWPLNTWWKKTVFVVVIFFVACFALWVSLPEKTKTEMTDYLKHSKEAQSPAAIPHGKGTSESIQGGDSNTPKVGAEVPGKKGKENTQKPLKGGIQQHTEGDQSPAVISGGDVKIDIGSKQK